MSASSASAPEAAGVAPIGEAGRGGEGSSSSATEAGQRIPMTLEDVMRAPSSNLPDVIVLESLPQGTDRKEVLDPKEDLWLTTADGRYCSPMVPLYVGEEPDTATFYVHRDILVKYEYFEKALCGGFLESNSQSLYFPDDDPGIFHFLIAYMYEGRYDPIKPMASALVPDTDKGKAKDTGLLPTGGGGDESLSGDDSAASSLAGGGVGDGSDISARSRRRHERRRRRLATHFERSRQKHPGAHRPGCGCPTCHSSASAAAGGPPCWACSAPRVPPHQQQPPPGPGPGPVGVVVLDRDGNPRVDPYPPPQRGQQRPIRQGGRRGQQLQPPHNYAAPPAPPAMQPFPAGGGPPLTGAGAAWWRMPESRIFGEDLRTWLLAYELNLDVYILANKFLVEDFKRAVARAAVDMLETAGADAAVPQVLRLCAKLRAGLPEADPLLRMVFARVGFLQGLLWKREPEATERFLVENPDVAAVMLRETVVRREEDFGGRNLPSMERPWSPPGGSTGPLDLTAVGGGWLRGLMPYGGYAGRPRW